MPNKTVGQVPADLKDVVQLRRFLTKLVENIDISFGFRGNEPFLVDAATLTDVSTSSDFNKRYSLLIS